MTVFENKSSSFQQRIEGLVAGPLCNIVLSEKWWLDGNNSRPDTQSYACTLFGTIPYHCYRSNHAYHTISSTSICSSVHICCLDAPMLRFVHLLDTYSSTCDIAMAKERDASSDTGSLSGRQVSNHLEPFPVARSRLRSSHVNQVRRSSFLPRQAVDVPPTRP